MDPQYIEPTRAGRLQLLRWVGALVLISIALSFSIDIYQDRMAEAVAKAAATDVDEDLFAELSGIAFEVAVLRAVYSGVIAGLVVWWTEKIRRAGRWPVPGEPVMFRTRIRAEPGYIKAVVILGYVAAFMVVSKGLLGFYLWYLIR